MNCIVRRKIGNIGNIVVHQQLNRQQTGNIGNILVNQQLNRQQTVPRYFQWSGLGAITFMGSKVCQQLGKEQR
jgi:hypothetical protein